MLRKNSSDRRFNTAAARIMATRKLPSDFFVSPQNKNQRESSLWSVRHEDAETHQPEIIRNQPLFTFYRSSSEDKLNYRRRMPQFLQPLQAAPKIFMSHRHSQQKLPPVSLLVSKTDGKENMQTINSSWFKNFQGSNKGKELTKLTLRRVTKQLNSNE